jgi:hypothetical protein
MGKKVLKQELVWDAAGEVLTAKYPGHGEVVFDTRGWSDGLRLAAFCHGVEQKVGDLKSGGTVAEKFEMAQRQRDSFEADSWNLTDRAVNVELVVNGIARVMGISPEQAAADLRAKYPDNDDLMERLKTARGEPPVKAAMAEIVAERARKAVKGAAKFEM